MSRLFAVLGFSLAVTFGLVALAPSSFQAEAAKPKAKQCVGTSLDGKQTKFKCAADQKCCYDAITNSGTCVASGAVCL